MSVLKVVKNGMIYRLWVEGVNVMILRSTPDDIDTRLKRLYPTTKGVKALEEIIELVDQLNYVGDFEEVES